VNETVQITFIIQYLLRRCQSFTDVRPYWSGKLKNFSWLGFPCSKFWFPLFTFFLLIVKKLN